MYGRFFLGFAVVLALGIGFIAIPLISAASVAPVMAAINTTVNPPAVNVINRSAKADRLDMGQPSRLYTSEERAALDSLTRQLNFGATPEEWKMGHYKI